MLRAVHLLGDAAVLDEAVAPQLEAETLNVWPETANEAAIAPLAMPNTMAPATAVAGTIMGGEAPPPGTTRVVEQILHDSSSGGWMSRGWPVVGKVAGPHRATSPVTGG